MEGSFIVFNLSVLLKETVHDATGKRLMFLSIATLSHSISSLYLIKKLDIDREWYF